MQDKPGILYEQLEPVVAGLGYTLVEAQSAHLKGISVVHVIVYHPDGVGTEDCVKISRLLYPRLEVLLNHRDINLEVSSPGLERKFSSWNEFSIFQGKWVKILVQNEDWVEGTITEYSETAVTIENNASYRIIQREAVIKAQLVYQEVR